MKRFLAVFFVFLITMAAWAEEDAPLTPLTVPQAGWVFSGVVLNEAGESYHYYLEIQKNYQSMQAIATLVDENQKRVVLHEETQQHIKKEKVNIWQVGTIFLRFNPINNSWIFGVKKQDGTGFNFKADMMASAEHATTNHQDLRAGVEFSVAQTGPLNGHLQIETNKQEQFVTAPKAWFRQVWVTKPQELDHPLQGILCDFQDGSAFYALYLQEADAVRGAVAGWRDEHGVSAPMSQFVNVQEKNKGSWLIDVTSPKLRLNIQDLLHVPDEEHTLVIGLAEGSKKGFCTINKDEIKHTDK